MCSSSLPLTSSKSTTNQNATSLANQNAAIRTNNNSSRNTNQQCSTRDAAGRQQTTQHDDGNVGHATHNTTNNRPSRPESSCSGSADSSGGGSESEDLGFGDEVISYKDEGETFTYPTEDQLQLIAHHASSAQADSLQDIKSSLINEHPPSIGRGAITPPVHPHSHFGQGANLANNNNHLSPAQVIFLKQKFVTENEKLSWTELTWLLKVQFCSDHSQRDRKLKNLNCVLFHVISNASANISGKPGADLGFSQGKGADFQKILKILSTFF